MSLRIIGGTFRRRQLVTPHGLATRPYTDRVRQIVFDRLDPIIEDARVADVFSGVGTMGLESLSRGAASCVFFEGDRAVHECLATNVETLAGDWPTMCWKTDIHRSSFCPKGRDECLPYTLVFMDPPYAQCPLFAQGEVLFKCMQRLARPRVTSADVTVVVRTPERFDLPDLPDWELDVHWPVSSMNLWVLRKSTQDTADDDSAATAEPDLPPDNA